MSGTANVNAGRVQQAGRTARQEVSATGGQAGKAAGEVAGTAAEQAKAVTGEVRGQARSVARDLRERVMNEAHSRTQRTAGMLRQWADDLTDLADNAPADSPARDLMTQAAGGGHRAADYLEEHGVRGLAEEAREFARRRPGAFLGGAVLAGFAIGRLAKADSDADSSGRGSSTSTSAPAPPRAPAPAAGQGRSPGDAGPLPSGLPSYPEA